MARTPKPSGLPDKGKKQGRPPNDARPLRAYFLIVCEGEKTELNYFRRFRVRADVKKEVLGLGDNTLSLVERTCELKQQDEYTDVWVVFDRDSFPPERFNEAIALAHRRDIKVAYSNEAFELWYWLHFDYQDTGISRANYKAKLTKRLGFPYEKNALGMYDCLLPRQPDAIRNARRLLDAYGPAHNPERDNPCTTVHLLVQELNRHVR